MIDSTRTGEEAEPHIFGTLGVGGALWKLCIYVDKKEKKRSSLLSSTVSLCDGRSAPGRKAAFVLGCLVGWVSDVGGFAQREREREQRGSELGAPVI